MALTHCLPASELVQIRQATILFSYGDQASGGYECHVTSSEEAQGCWVLWWAWGRQTSSLNHLLCQCQVFESSYVKERKKPYLECICSIKWLNWPQSLLAGRTQGHERDAMLCEDRDLHWILVSIQMLPAQNSTLTPGLQHLLPHPPGGTWGLENTLPCSLSLVVRRRDCSSLHVTHREPRLGKLGGS